MTRQEKLSAVDAKYLPQIETKKDEWLKEKQKLEEKASDLASKQNEYDAKILEVNRYYDAQDEIARLQKLIEPTI